ncbi:hypothetical protein DPMN_031304 [Dreissena polymorpha]|uniref:Uncharacterized protein n=1 Tax=Dreissena polymorpha TaxID=45954 RepID=A0A9D4M2J1_DREPO|nr:hypothetical protein DPMN_031304 [Dreissena polymorpha]
MWTNGRRTKTNFKTSPEQSGELKSVKTAPPPGGHFHVDWAKNVTSRVHVIQLTGTIFYLNSRIKETNVLTKFHENWAKNVTFRVFTCFHYIHIEKNAPPTGGHVFSPIWTIFELVQEINKTNGLSNFHDDWAKSVTSSVFTRKTDPPTGGHVFQRTRTTFKLNQHIIKTNILTKLHEDWAWSVTSTVFTSFQLHRDIIGTNLLTKFHEDRTKKMWPLEKTAPPTDGHIGHKIFELDQDIIGTKLLTKFHEDRKRNVPSKTYTVLF